MENNSLEIIACSIFKYELEKIAQLHNVHIPVSFYNSYLHLFPADLSKELTEKIENKINEHKKVILVCGDCHPFMKEMSNKENVSKIPGCNCVEIMLGKELRRKLQKEGAFFLLPEWTVRWREIFKELLELPPEHIKSLLNEQHKKFVYLDTGVLPVPYNEIKECADFFKLPYEIETISIDFFLNALQTLIDKMEEKL
jgi:hypothetical protein